MEKLFPSWLSPLKLVSLHLYQTLQRKLLTVGADVSAIATIDDDSLKNYKFYPGTVEPYKPGLSVFMAPFISGATAPITTIANTVYGVQKRLFKVQQVKTEISPFVLQCAKEYMEFIKPETPLFPVEPDDVFEKQDRPSQRVHLENAMNLPPESNVGHFQKREAYSKFKAPRNINTEPDDVRLRWACYCYAFAAHLKTFSWYAFGKVPREISERMSEIGRDAWNAIETDFVKLDGSRTEVVYRLQVMFFLSVFHFSLHDELRELLRKCVDQKVRATVGEFVVYYFSMFAQLSGKSCTALLIVTGKQKGRT